MTARSSRTQIVTGNDLLEGHVVYLTATDEWSYEIAEAALADTPEAAEGLMARALASSRDVVGVYLAEARRDAAGRAAPAHFREVFRTRGPSNYPGHGRQAEEL